VNVVNHVSVLSTLQMVWGGTMVALGTLIVCSAPVGALQEGDLVVLLVGLVMAMLYLVFGVANLITGWLVRQYRGRIPALLAMVGSLFTCPFCGLLAVALPIYGFVVLLNAEVARAFTTGGPEPDEFGDP
jgi:hypothetical protein